MIIKLIISLTIFSSLGLTTDRAGLPHLEEYNYQRYIIPKTQNLPHAASRPHTDRYLDRASFINLTDAS